MLELVDKKTRLVYKTKFQFKIGAVTNVATVTPTFAFNLQNEYYAKESAPFDFGVGLQPASSSGAYTFIWYKDGAAVQRNNTGFYSKTAGEMEVDSSGLYYPAEGVYWVEIADAVGNVLRDASNNVIQSNHATLYIFTD